MAVTPYAQADSFPGIVVGNAAALRAVASNLFIDGGKARIFAPPSPPPADFYWDSTSTATDDGVTVIQPSDVTGAGRWLLETGGGGITPPAGDIGGTTSLPIVRSIQGLATVSAGSASAGDIVNVEQNPPWAEPEAITFDGTYLWVGDGNAGEGGQAHVYRVLQSFFGTTFTSYSLPTGITGVNDIVNDGTYLYLACNSGFSDIDRLVVVAIATGAVVGLGQVPIVSPTGVALDNAGNVWTVDEVNGLSKFSIAQLLTNYPTDTAPTATLAMPNSDGTDVVFDGAYLYVSDGGALHKVDPTVPSIVSTYNYGIGYLGRLLFNVALGSYVFAPVGTSVLQVSTSTMTLAATMTMGGGGHATSLFSVATDTTYIYAGDRFSGWVEQFNPGTSAWVQEFQPNGIPGSLGTAGMCQGAGATVWACEPHSTPPGQQGIQQFASFGPDAYYIGPLAMVYTPLPPVQQVRWIPGYIFPPTSGWLTAASASDNRFYFYYQDGNYYLAVGQNGVNSTTFIVGGAVPTPGATQFAFDINSVATNWMTVWNGSTSVGELLQYTGTSYLFNADNAFWLQLNGGASGIEIVLDNSNVTTVNGAVQEQVSSTYWSLLNGFLWLKSPIAEPAAPASGFVVYIDNVTGNLIAKASTGTKTTIATP